MANRYHEGVLSDRQYDSLLLLGRGLKVAEIGAKLNASEGTVSAHLARARRKYNAKNNVQAYLRMLSGMEG